jgi:hypothetical protein
MLPSGPLRAVLADLDSLHSSPGITAQRQNYYGKLALIELCGWIEQSLDNMARVHCSSIRNMNELDMLLKNVHGFNYKNLRSILIQITGIVNVLDIEHSLITKGASYQILNSQLGSLSSKRNDAAHTHMPGVQVTYDAPSRILAELNQIEPSLLDMQYELSIV